MTYPLAEPDVCVIARRDLIGMLAARGVTLPWYISEVPAVRPADNRFVVIEQLDTRRPTDFAADVMVQFRVYHPDSRECRRIATLINALVPTLPAGFEIQSTDHMGGPTEQPDPDVPEARRWLVTWWLTAMCEPV
ncbi:tail terminator [Mycobacterium phage MalagasyRose]|uniref:Tail terminator n=1 Tax=Mycobacterium phage MalagasyRose TaxID=2599870 RepID=A0A5J6TEL7_9CAUD|nr:tail terminator [Mycobacterium phage MalagasyRose]QFG08868.1 tail terminator [Mycobacterium phage MalagasyRose]